jgi:hypothetical protein
VKNHDGCPTSGRCGRSGGFAFCKTSVLFAPNTCPPGHSALCSKSTWGSASRNIMQRWTARFLLLIALLGTLLPVAMQASTAPSHACCRRTGPHHCTDSAQTHSEEAVLRDTGCCNHDCCRAVASSHYAHPAPSVAASRAENSSECTGPPAAFPISDAVSLLHSRAPPTLSLA